MSKHTRDPWSVEYSESDGYRIGGPYLSRIADVYGDDSEANSTLIAAAPELLNMLKVAVHALKRRGIDGQDIHLHELEAAIAKAEGRDK